MAGIVYESYYGISGLGSPYLMHHGTKGMKWYQRRYQNEDGSLTTLGRIHYGIGKGRKEEGAKEKVAAYDAKRKEERAARKKEKIIKSGSANVVARNSDKLTDKELQEAINRINLMTKVNELKPPKESIVKSITTKLETMNKFMTTVSNVKETGDKLKEQFRDPEEKAEEERQKALQKLVDEKRGDDFRRKLSDVIKNARENTKGSDADVERAVKLASDEFVKNYRDAETGKDKDYSSFKERLAKQNERKQEKEWAASKKQAENEVKQGLKNKRDFQNELAKLREKAEKAQAAKEKAGQNEKNESWISKLSSVTSSGKSVVQSLFKAATSTPKISSISSSGTSRNTPSGDTVKDYTDELLNRMQAGTEEWRNKK